MNSKTQRIVIAAMMASMVCVATMIIKVPSPMKGYVNVGDAMVLLSAWLLAPGYGFAAAAIGSALADLFYGYIIYAPATFVIKGCMALLAYLCLRVLRRRIGRFPSQIIGGLAAETLMVLGYYLFEGVLYGFVPSLVNIPANCAQGVISLLLGIVLIKLCERMKISAP